MIGILLAVLAATLQEGPLLPGQQVRGEILEETEPVSSSALEGYDGVRAKVYEINVAQTGVYRFELVSHLFDAFLFLEGPGDATLAADDDSLGGTHARLVLPLEPGVSYRLLACALHDEWGSFSLRMERGDASALSKEETKARDLLWSQERYDEIHRVRGSEDRGLISACLGLGREVQDRGRLTEAAELYAEGIALCKRWEDNSAYEPTLCNNMAEVLRLRGRYEEAVRFGRRAVDLFSERKGAQSDFVIVACGTLGNILSEFGRHEEASDRYQQAIETLEARGETNGYSMIRNLIGLSASYRQQVRLHEARVVIDRAEECLKAFSEPVRSLLSARVWESQANNLAAMGHLSEAVERLEAALQVQIGMASEAAVGQTMFNLAAHLSTQGDHDRALLYADEAIERIKKADGGRHPIVVKMIIMRAGLKIELGESEGVVDSLLEARSILVDIGLEHESLGAVVHLALAETHALMGDPESALPWYEAALQFYRERDLSTPFGVRTLRGLAKAHARLGRFDEAAQTGLLAVENSERLVFRSEWGLSEGERFRSLAQLDTSISALLSVLSGDEQFVKLAWRACLKRKARVARVMRSTLARAEELRSERSEEKLYALRRVQSELSKVLFGAPGKRADAADRDAWHERLTALRKSRNDLELELRREVGEDDSDLSSGRVASSVPDGAVLLDFLLVPVGGRSRQLSLRTPGRTVHSDDQLIAWAVRDGRLSTQFVGLAGDLEPLARAFVESLQSRRGAAPIIEDGGAGEANRALREALWEPLASLVGDATTVFVAPEGFIATLPFGAIRDEDGTYLVERFAFHYLDDPMDLTKDFAANSINPTLLAIGGVDYRRGSSAEGVPNAEPRNAGLPNTASPNLETPVAESPGADGEGQLAMTRGYFPRRWSSLPSTLTEAQSVLELHEERFGAGVDRTILTGSEPTETRLKELIPGYNVLHMATHGFFQPEGLPSMWLKARGSDGRVQMHMDEAVREVTGYHPGLLSGLVSAGVHDSSSSAVDEGYLTAEEVSWLDLRLVDLVVLSACDTGLGLSRTGEGLVGLRRAFRIAGANTVVSSLWPVADEATAALMTEFYANLWLDEMPRGDALRQAQLSMLDQNRVEYGEGKPSTWAGFVLSGEWR